MLKMGSSGDSGSCGGYLGMVKRCSGMAYIRNIKAYKEFE